MIEISFFLTWRIKDVVNVRLDNGYFLSNGMFTIMDSFLATVYIKDLYKFDTV